MDGHRTKAACDGDLCELEFCGTCYKPEAVAAAAYKFTAECSVELGSGPHGSTQVTIRRKQSCSRDVRSLSEDFRNEVLDQQVRLTLDERFGSVRDRIVEQAFQPIADAHKKKAR